ncbi:MAG: glucose uptake family protein [Candidatus Micrarchaeota archaeon]|nr:MAG: glucose uptake family protein [Candidatus Micrarchaeota archaeon]
MKELELMIISTVFYGINNILEYVAISNLTLGDSILSIGLGIAISDLILYRYIKDSIHLKRKIYYIFSTLATLFIVIYSLIMFAAYKSYDLASIFPLMGLSVFVFFFIDLIKYNKKLRYNDMLMLFIGISILVIGIFLLRVMAILFMSKHCL